MLDLAIGRRYIPWSTRPPHDPIVEGCYENYSLGPPSEYHPPFVNARMKLCNYENPVTGMEATIFLARYDEFHSRCVNASTQDQHIELASDRWYHGQSTAARTTL